ncbi:probable cytochrome P450 6a17 [Cylas formicarius]|uniref:probable cytochrome P450 6a17 n=1 Tax=Cylas formicarius TaxID=197179 RepID=UPI002958A726|nr:probable cytochrome P450 6a17 [Cylas formicarius]
MALAILFAVTITLVAVFFLFSKWRYTYWKRRGLTQLEPDFFYGNTKKMFTGELSTAETYREIYRQLKSMNIRHGGAYSLLKPVYIPIDPLIIKHIIQNDFPHFTGHGFYYHENDMLSKTLFRMDGPQWKILRAKMTPVFTVGKIKMIFETLVEKIIHLERVGRQCAAKGEPVHIKDIAARFTSDVIASIAFGIECHSMEDPDAEFRVYGRKIFRPRLLKTWLEEIVPWKILGYTGYKTQGGGDIERFFQNIVRDTIAYREKNNVFRKDFLHLLIQLKNRGELSEDGSIVKEKIGDNTVTEEEIIAQCFLFFIAGFEPSATTMTFGLFELARNQEVQDKVREEVRTVLEKYGGKFTYEAAQELVYTEKVVQETLRKYPPLSTLTRVCSKDYKVPGSDLVIEKGTYVQISAWGLHLDPDYFPNPEVFDPENFSVERKAARPDFTYLPFGDGPRICTGWRFGLILSKLGLAALLKGHRFAVNEKTKLPILMEKGSMIITARGDVWLDIEKID